MSGIEMPTSDEDDIAFRNDRILDLFDYSPAVAAGGTGSFAGRIGARADGTIPRGQRSK
jgi:hypothetical protein